MKKRSKVISFIALAMLTSRLALAAGTGDRDMIEAVDTNKIFSCFPNFSTRYKDLNMWGVAFSLLQSQIERGSIRIGIFSDSAKAQVLFQKKIMMSSMPPPDAQDISGRIGDRGILWRNGIFFCRDNAFIEILLPNVDIAQVALKLDNDLQFGRGGTRRAMQVQVPKVVDVEFTNDAPQAILTTSMSPGFTALLDAGGFATPHHQVVQAVCFATEGCVMAEPMKCDKAYLSAKIEAAKEKERKEKEPSPEARRKQVEEAVTTLRDKGASPYQRNKAVVALGSSGDGSAVPILLAELEGSIDPVVKQNTIAALGRLRAKQAVPHLLKMLDAPITGNVSDEGEWEAIFRRQAANSLGYIGDSSALATLKKAMDATHEYQSVRDAAKSAIRKIEKPEGQ